MKLNIITMHAMHNPGSVFQAYALQSFLEKMNYETEIIDYRPSYFYTEGSLIKYIIKRFLFFFYYQKRARKFDEFIKSQMTLTEMYKTNQQLESANFGQGIYIVGSDQLWNTDFKCGKDPAYYLKFVKKGKKISYSTSVGKKIIDNDNLDFLKRNLNDFNYLSVREASTSFQLSSLLKRRVSWVCDPVLLLEASDYQKFIGPQKIDRPYVMVYMSPSSEMLNKIVEYYRNLDYYIVLVGGYTKRCYCDYHLKDAGPLDFLTYIYYADVVISTSFHATAFCHILHKDFVTIVPVKNGERIISLLNTSGLEYKAVLGSSLNFKELNKNINWDAVDEKINKYRQDSVDYLNDALSNS